MAASGARRPAADNCRFDGHTFRVSFPCLPLHGVPPSGRALYTLLASNNYAVVEVLRQGAMRNIAFLFAPRPVFSLVGRLFVPTEGQL